MTKFIMGLLLGLILGIGGTAAFLISAQGGDYLVVTSPRVRELEAALKQGDQERTWLRDQIRDSADVVNKLESRFIALATRFDDLGARASKLLASPPQPNLAARAATHPNRPTTDSTGAATENPANVPGSEATKPAQATPTPSTAAATRKPSTKEKGTSGQAPVKSPEKEAGGGKGRPTPAGKM